VPRIIPLRVHVFAFTLDRSASASGDQCDVVQVQIQSLGLRRRSRTHSRGSRNNALNPIAFDLTGGADDVAVQSVGARPYHRFHEVDLISTAGRPCWSAAGWLAGLWWCARALTRTKRNCRANRTQHEHADRDCDCSESPRHTR